jgi:hypothetical protein
MRIRLLVVGLGAVVWSGIAGAQAMPTASQALEISVFGAGTGTATELGGGKNTGITAGLDVTFRNYFHVRPSLEIRGTYPIDSGSVVGLTDGMVGLKLQKDYGRFHPYVDVLYGRGALDYQNGGIVIGTFRYDRTTTNVYGAGAGLDLRLTRQFYGKADVQFERWNTPVTDTGVIYPIPVSIGIAYRFDFNHYGHRRVKRSKVDASGGAGVPNP